MTVKATKVYVIQNPGGKVWESTAALDRDICIRKYVEDATTFGAFEGFAKITRYECAQIWDIAERIGFKMLELPLAKEQP